MNNLFERKRKLFEDWCKDAVYVLAPYFDVNAGGLDVPKVEAFCFDGDGFMPQPHFSYTENKVAFPFTLRESEDPAIGHEVSHYIHWKLNKDLFGDFGKAPTDYTSHPREFVACWGERIFVDDERVNRIPIVQKTSLSEMSRMSRDEIWEKFPDLSEGYYEMERLMGIER